jgi:hypothetical protein
MPVTAKQVAVTSTKIWDPTDAAGDHVTVTVQNLGPNAIYLCTSAPAVVASSLQLPSGGAYTYDTGNEEVYAITTVLQVTPADTRVSHERRAE